MVVNTWDCRQASVKQLAQRSLHYVQQQVKDAVKRVVSKVRLKHYSLIHHTTCPT